MSGIKTYPPEKALKSKSAKMTASKRRILVICPKGSLDSGGVISNFELIKYLISKGYEAKIITSWEGNYNTTLTSIGIANTTIPYNWWTPLDTPEKISNRVLPAIAAIVNEIKNFKPDVVITNTSHIPWGAIAASMTNTPHIWTVREYPIKNFEYLSEKVDFIKQYSNKIMVNSKELATYYRKSYGYSPGQFISYVDVSGVKLNKKITRTRLISPNYMSVGKNQIELVEAVSILRKRRPDLNLKVLLMGEKETTYGPKLDQAILDNQLTDIIEVYERIEDPWSKVGVNDILVQTSLSESIGRTTTEAMKLGLPVIASDIPGHREAFSLGGGTLYKVGNPNDLARTIESLLDNPIETKKAAQAAQKRALKNMSAEASNGPFLRELQNIIGQSNPMGVNRFIWPYFERFILGFEQQHEELVIKNRETDMLIAAIEDIRHSRAYKIGRLQTDGAKKVLNALKNVIKK